MYLEDMGDSGNILIKKKYNVRTEMYYRRHENISFACKLYKTGISIEITTKENGKTYIKFTRIKYAQKAIKFTRIKHAQKLEHYSQLGPTRRTRALQSSGPRRQQSQHDVQRD